MEVFIKLKSTILYGVMIMMKNNDNNRTKINYNKKYNNVDD